MDKAGHSCKFEVLSMVFSSILLSKRQKNELNRLNSHMTTDCLNLDLYLFCRKNILFCTLSLSLRTKEGRMKAQVKTYDNIVIVTTILS